MSCIIKDGITYLCASGVIVKKHFTLYGDVEFYSKRGYKIVTRKGW